MSYANIPVNAVITACDRYFQSRADRISEKREAMIERTMKTKCIKTGWFSKCYPTRDEAISYLKSSSDTGLFSEWDSVVFVGSNRFEEIKKLHSLAKSAQAAGALTVCVSAAHAQLLGNKLFQVE